MKLKIFYTTFIVLILFLGSGCQSRIRPDINKTPEPVSPQVASTTPDLDESAIIAILAAANKQDPATYELHDVKQSGDYRVGSWSSDGRLSPQTFWAVKDNASWRLVYVGKDMPACELLSLWPADIKSGCRDDLNGKQISNFSQCVSAGGQIEATKPRRCLDGRGNIFVEVLAGTIDKRYISQDLNKCAALDFDCTTGEKRFMDSQGCGCQTSADIVKTVCQEVDRAGEVCAQIYTPTCGWFKAEVKCLRYPCALNFSNPCEACHNRQIESWTKGECPK
jgi:hypothetical protein